MESIDSTTHDTCRGMISLVQVGQGVAEQEAMDLAHKERLADEIAHEQPSLFASFLAQHKVGVAYEKMESLHAFSSSATLR